MVRKMLLSLAVVVMLSGMVTSVSAVNVYWTGASFTADPNWDDTFNWDIVPIAGDSVYIDGGPSIPIQPLVSTGVAAVGGTTRVGVAGDGSLTITGGSLTLTGEQNHLILGEGVGSSGTLDVSGGSVVANSLWVGNSGPGLFTITGGTVSLHTEGLYVDRFNRTNSTAVIAGGVVDANGFTIGNFGLIDVGGGTLTLHGDVTGAVSTQEGNGRMVAYSGGSTLIYDYNSTTPGKTTVTATAYTKAWMPNPSNGAVGVVWDANLSWLGGDGVTDFDVYFGTVTPPVTKVSTAQAGTTYNPAGDMAIDTTYYWRIDGNGGSITGDIWSFTTRGYEAYNPSPMDGAAGISADTILSWTAASNAVSHDVYFGTDYDDVNDANTNDVECVSIEQTEPNYTPTSTLDAGTTYYWRIDEHDIGDVVVKGQVWEFTTFAVTSLSWDDGAVSNHLWNDPCNWSDDTHLPGPVTNISVTLGTGEFGPLIDATVTALCNAFRFFGPDTAPETILTMTGGTLDVAEGIFPQDGNSIFEMSGGVLTAVKLWAGDFRGAWNMGYSKLHMTGGTINVSSSELYVAMTPLPGSTVAIQLDGGTINSPSLSMGGGTIDVAGGTLILDGDKRNPIDVFVTNGYITTYGGAVPTVPLIVDYNNLNFEKTTITVETHANAWNPNPEDGQLGVAPDVILSWIGGTDSTLFDVYFDTVNPPVTKVSTAQADTTYDPPGDLAIGTTYYWRIDDGVTGDVWSFTTYSDEAYNPAPSDEAAGVPISTILSWSAGLGAVSHNVYIGTDYDDVNDANTNDAECVSIEQAGLNYTPVSLLGAGVTYYWRIDEIDAGDVVTKGYVWEFTTFVESSLRWDDGDVSGHLWNKPSNWVGDTSLPGSVTDVAIRLKREAGDPNFGAVIDSSVAAASNIIRFYSPNSPSETALTMTGGTLDAASHVIAEKGSSIFVMSGGVANMYSLWVGDMEGWNLGRLGRLNMTAGTINITGEPLYVSRSPITGYLGVQFDGGTINAPSLQMGGGYMDITGGTLILDGDARDTINTYAGNGWLTAFGGSGFIIPNYDDINPGKTTVLACATGSDADFTGDCAVDTADLKILTDDWLIQVPSEKLWEFDMSTDPCGPEADELVVRVPASGEYNMTDLSGALHVTGYCLLDSKGSSSNSWDVTLDYTAKSSDSTGIYLWVGMNCPSVPGDFRVVAVVVADEGSNQTLKIGNVIGDEYAVTETGFADDTMIDIDITYHYATETLDWSATDGSKSASGTGVSYGSGVITAYTGDSGGFTILDGSFDGTSGYGYIDYLRFHCAGSDEGLGVTDLNDDEEVNFEDFALLAEDWLI